MNSLRLRPWRLWLLVAAATPAWAGTLTTSFLTPSQYSATLGDSVMLRWNAGAAKDAQPVAWPSGEVSWLFIRGGGEQENRHDVRPQRAQDNFITLKIEQPAVTLVGAERPVVREVAGAELRTFLEQNVAGDSTAAEANRLAADRKYRVRDIASAKTLIRVPTADGQVGPSAIATSKTGLAGEIRPQFDPTVAPVGSDLPLTIYVNGDKLPGATIQATNVATAKTTTMTAGPSGSAHFRVTDTGVWRVEFHWAQPLQDDPAADWVVYNATLTFEVTKGGAQ
jgi:hypothetical protein